MFRLALTRAALYSLVTLGTAWQVATHGKSLNTLTAWDWLDIGVGITVLWGTAMISFLDRTASKLRHGDEVPLLEDEELKKQPENG